MADQSELKQKNSAFLQKLEKIRLNKTCFRIIDLRGKVAGECQAYEFGGRVHYLDDRAYLIVKQLLSHTGGQYTVAVYEAIIKSLKQLDQQSELAPPPVTAPRFKRLKVDDELQRNEQRLSYSTSVTLRMDDVVYTGNTVDISAKAIKVIIKRSHTLQVGQKVTVSYTDLEERYKESIFSAHYQIIKLQQDSAYTSLILLLDITETATQKWLENWLSRQGKQRNINVDFELLNLEKRLYQRLWLSHSNQFLVWQYYSDNKLHYQSAFASIACNNTIAYWPKELINLTAKLIEQPVCTSYLVVSNGESYWASVMTDTQAVSTLLTLASQLKQGQLYRIEKNAFSLDLGLFDDISTHFEKLDLVTESNIPTLIDADHFAINMTELDCFPQYNKSDIEMAAVEHYKCQPSANKPAIPNAYPLTQFIKRRETRFKVRTPVIIHSSEQSFEGITQEVSIEGLSMMLPKSLNLTLNQNLVIDFPRWQNQTKKVSLAALPYQIKNIQQDEDMVLVGMQRRTQHCTNDVNQFFAKVIKENQLKLKKNHQDEIQLAESNLFGSGWLRASKSIPLFLGIDPSGHRQISCIATNTENAAGEKSDAFWQGMENEIAFLHEWLKKHRHKQSYLFQTTVYGFASSQGEWKWLFDEQFSNPQEKERFLQRALSSSEYCFFQCLLSPITNDLVTSHKDLFQQLINYRSQQAHRVQEIRQNVSQLFAMMELIDISSLIRAGF